MSESARPPTVVAQVVEAMRALADEAPRVHRLMVDWKLAGRVLLLP